MRNPLDEQRRIVAYLDELDLSPRPSLKGRGLVAQGIKLLPFRGDGREVGFTPVRWDPSGVGSVSLWDGVRAGQGV